MLHRPFQRRDFDEFRSWFIDPLLQKTLGPMDEEWLEYVLAESPPAQFSFFVDDSLVAVIGISFPVQEHPYFVVTDVAVLPAKRRQGIAAKAISLLQDSFVDTEFCNHQWHACVEPDNSGGKAFFDSLGWQRDTRIQNDMYYYRSNGPNDA